MNIKQNIPVVVFFSTFLFGFVLTGLYFKSEIKGTILGGSIEYDTVEGLITTSNTRYKFRRSESAKVANIWYGYEIDSVIYVSNLVNFAADYHDKDYYLKKYPLKKRVTVYYQKNNPSFAVLEPNKKSWFVVFQPFIWIMAGGLILFLFYLSTKYKWIDDVMRIFDRR